MKIAMFRTFLITCILVITTSCETIPVSESGSREFTEVVNIPNQDQSMIYNKTRQWFSQYFVSGESVIDYEDPSTGTIIGNGIADNGRELTGLIKYKFKYNIRIDTQDNKFRVITKIIEYTNTNTSDNTTYTTPYVNAKRITSAEEKVKEIVKSIESYVTDNSLEGDW